MSAFASRVCAACAFLALLLIARGALAEDPSLDFRGGLIVFVDGVGAERARGELVRAIPGKVPIVRTARIKKRRGERLGTTLAKPAKRTAFLRDVGQAIAASGADGAIIVYLGPARRKGHEERLLLVRGKDAEVVLEQELTLRTESPATRVKRWSAVFQPAPPPAVTTPEPTPEPVVSETGQTGEATANVPAAEPEPKKKKKKKKKRKKKETYEDLHPGPNWMAVSAGFEWGARFFKHSEPSTRSERSYIARGIGSAVVGLKVFPFISSEERFWQSFSVDFEYATSLGLISRRPGKRSDETSSNNAEDPTVASRFYRYGVGVRSRLPLSSHPDSFWGLAFGLGYAQWVFTMNAPAGSGRVADANYYMVKPSLGVEVRAKPMTLAATVSYLHLLSVAELGPRNPEGWQGGLDTELLTTVQLAPWFNLGASAAFTRFFYDLSPILGAKEPGQATDDYVRLSAFGQLTF